jgi:hypothetical protein
VARPTSRSAAARQLLTRACLSKATPVVSATLGSPKDDGGRWSEAGPLGSCCAIPPANRALSTRRYRLDAQTRAARKHLWSPTFASASMSTVHVELAAPVLTARS